MPARDLAFESLLKNAIEGEIQFDDFTRGRYATDASIYQIIPKGVIFPKHEADLAAALKISADHGVPVIARGGGTSQNGQPIGSGLIVDMSRNFGGILDFDRSSRTVRVRPGTVLDTLNTFLGKQGLFFPVEPSNASRCTIGECAAITPPAPVPYVTAKRSTMSSPSRRCSTTASNLPSALNRFRTTYRRVRGSSWIG
ncbi:FAD-binding oxidoreductase [Bradyrhizobium sp. sBnM-33]|uniref:FAD-binding oxidoreductase n=1 Tax=Bradyrhizobium sp. sBnM-33 TaxID=2831780 RepID=UPI00390C49A1